MQITNHFADGKLARLLGAAVLSLAALIDEAVKGGVHFAGIVGNANLTELDTVRMTEGIAFCLGHL